jgi:hypothetical protein
MEKLLIRILNRALLVGCVVLLAGAVLMAVIAGINFLAAGHPAADHSDIAIAYVPLPPLPPPSTATAPNENSTDRLSPEDIQLMRTATPGCQALGRFASTISSNRLEFHGSGLTTCERAQLKTAKEFGDRAVNYLTASLSYFAALANDPHVGANYQNLTDDQAKAVVDGISSDFAEKFRGEIEAQNSRNVAAQVDATARRIMFMTLFGAAGAAFFAFLFIAFLIVFLRIEKHLETISTQTDGLPRTR